MKFSINDVVQVQSVCADLEYVGLLGYVTNVIESSNPTVTVSFYHAQEKGENAYVTTRDFLGSELYLCGQPNPELLPA